MTRQTSLPWKCTIDDCDEEAKYHLVEKRKHQYFCSKHWSIRLGYKKYKKKEK